MHRRKYAVFFLCLSLFWTLSACGKGEGAPSLPDTEGKLLVSVTFNAPAEFARAVGGDKAAVSTIIPDGSEPHDFEPKAQDIRGLSAADVFIYNGLGLESWAEEAVNAAGNDRLIAVDASAGINPLPAVDEKEGGRYDPHAWLSLKCAETQVANITAAFIKADPDHADYYESNCAAYTEKLEALYQEYAGKFSACGKKSFVTGHAAFAYLCRDFSMKQESVEDVFAAGEPSAKRLVTLIDYCRANNVKTIFAEQATSQEVSHTLAEEVGAKIETIYTIESEEDGKSYLVRMEDNLRKIYDSLTE